MKLSLRIVALTLVLGAALSCSGPVTKLTDVWSDPALNGPMKFNKVLVVVLARSSEVRKTAEGRLMVMMKNTIGVPSYMAVSEETAKDRAKMEAMLEREGFDGAIVIRMVSAKQTIEWHPTSYAGFMGYYTYAYPMAMSPGYLSQDTDVRVETRIFSLKDDKIVYGAFSNTAESTDWEVILVQVAEAVAADLKARGFIQ